MRTLSVQEMAILNGYRASYLLLILIPVTYYYCLPTRSIWPDHRDRRLQVAVFDSETSGHEEVLAPLLYTLNQVPDVDLTVYRGGVRDGFFDMAWFFNDTFQPWEKMLQPAILSQVDVIVMPTPEKDLERLLVATEALLAHPQMRIIVVVHRYTYYEMQVKIGSDKQRTLQSAAFPQKAAWMTDLMRTGRTDKISLMTLSPHVNRYTKMVLKRDTLVNWDVQTFIPVFPNATQRTVKHRDTMNKAVIQGSLNLQRRDYNRVFTSLTKHISAAPGLWGYGVVPNGTFDSLTPVLTAKNRFELLLLGKRKAGRPNPIIPQGLAHVVDKQENVSFKEYYDLIASADILLPVFARTTLYLQMSASSSIAAAILSHTPILVSAREMQAYSYLRPPAVILRNKGEDEVEAIARMRALGSYYATREEDWTEYIEELTRDNLKVMTRLLRPAPPARRRDLPILGVRKRAVRL